MGIHYDYKSTRGMKAMEKAAKRERKLAERKAKREAKVGKKKEDNISKTFLGVVPELRALAAAA